MKVNWSIVHNLIKEQNKTGATIDSSEDILPKDQKELELIVDLNDKYKFLRNLQARFLVEDGKPNLFLTSLNKYLLQNSASEFITFTKSTLSELRTMISQIHFAKGGYILFVDYESYGHFVGIFFIRNKKGNTFIKSSSANRYEIINPEHIDIEKMAMACRINLDLVSNKDKRHISFIKRANEPLSDYFIKWISVDDKEDDKQDTTHLHELICSLPLPIKSNGVQYQLTELLQDVHSHIKTLPDQRVNLIELSKVFYNDEDKLINAAEIQQRPISPEFKADNVVLKKFINIQAKAEKIAVQFPLNLYGTKVIVDDNNTKITIHSEKLAEKLREEMRS